jgi:hypothetical protein
MTRGLFLLLASHCFITLFDCFAILNSYLLIYYGFPFRSVQPYSTEILIRIWLNETSRYLVVK